MVSWVIRYLPVGYDTARASAASDGLRAPSARNGQPWESVVVTEPEVKRELESIYSWRQAPHEAPVGIVVLYDETASPKFCLLDCTNAVTYLMLVAHAIGLGTVC